MAHLTVTESVVHQRDGCQPLAVANPFAVILKTDEQSFVREITVGEQWMQLDTGWLDSCSALLVRNRPPFWNVNPTEEERKEAQEAIVELRHDGDSGIWLIPPGQDMRGRPQNLNLLLRCRRGKAKVEIIIIPE